MVVLVYAKTTTTYTSKVMPVNYVACRTKWRLATGAYRLAEMLDADWSVDVSVGGASLIWRKVNCDTTEATKVVNSVSVLPLFMFGAVIICTNTYVYRVAQRHARQTADIQRRIVFICIFIA